MSDTLPTVVVTSVVRSAYQGQSHGGVYLVDLESGDHQQVIDWDNADISWEGRGADRGLRGIAFHGGCVYLAASDEIFVYDERFNLQRSIRNPYLKHCHEICVSQGRLLLTSTGYDSVLSYDLIQERFVAGYTLRFRASSRAMLKYGRKRMRPRPTFGVFDPERPGGPSPGDTTHLNSVTSDGDRVYVSGTRLGRLYAIAAGGTLTTYARTSYGTHNAQPFRDGVLANDTVDNRVVYCDRRGRPRMSFPIVTYDPESLENADLARGHARATFGRGLTVHEDRRIIGGSSPATVSVHDLATGSTERRINLTMDVRNAIHGLEPWPFDGLVTD
ncbi:MAG: hypothetical protein M3O70_05995 [Actinomycetota bacterium]|nr:hypothetical protein [Actinomycetota bacterium]